MHSGLILYKLKLFLKKFINKTLMLVKLIYLINGEFKHEVRQFEKSYDNQQAEQISLMV